MKTDIQLEVTMTSECDMVHIISRVWLVNYSFGDWNDGGFIHLIGSLYWKCKVKKCH